MTLNVNYQDAKTLISTYYDDDRLVSMISIIIYFHILHGRAYAIPPMSELGFIFIEQVTSLR